MVNTEQSKFNVLRLRQVQTKLGLARSTIYLKIKEESFPKPISLGSRAIGWIESEIDAWLASRMELRGDEGIQ